MTPEEVKMTLLADEGKAVRITYDDDAIVDAVRSATRPQDRSRRGHNSGHNDD